MRHINWDALLSEFGVKLFTHELNRIENNLWIVVFQELYALLKDNQLTLLGWKSSQWWIVPSTHSWEDSTFYFIISYPYSPTAHRMGRGLLPLPFRYFRSSLFWAICYYHDNTAGHGNLKLPRFYYVCTWWHVEFSSTGILLDIDMHRAGDLEHLWICCQKTEELRSGEGSLQGTSHFVIMRSMGQKGCTGMRGRIQPCARSERRT